MTIPKGHKWLICTCPICTEIRHFKSKGKRRPSMLKHLYEAHRNGHVGTFGRALGTLSALWEFVLIYLLGNKNMCWWGIFNYKNPFKNAYSIPFKDGYALSPVGWIFWIWWGLVSVFLGIVWIAIIIACAIYIGIWLTCFFTISWLYIPVLVYSVVCELPASIVNKDLGKIDKRKRLNNKIYTIKHWDVIIGWSVGLGLGVGSIFLIHIWLQNWVCSYFLGMILGFVMGLLTYFVIPSPNYS